MFLLFAVACHVCDKEFKFDEDSYDEAGLVMCSLDCVHEFYADARGAYEWGGEPGIYIPLGIERYQCNHCDDWLELGGADAADFLAHDSICPNCVDKAW